MDIKFLEYQLASGGFIHNWLVVGPHITPIEPPKPGADLQEARRRQASQNNQGPENPISDPPVDRGPFKVGSDELRWRYVRCRDDHSVHASVHIPTWSYVRTWALSQVKIGTSITAQCTLRAFGPVDVWIGGNHCLRTEAFSQGAPASSTFKVELEAGINQILVRFDQVTAGDCPNLLSFQIDDLQDEAASSVKVLVPTQTKRPARWLRLEKALENAYLEKAVYYKGNLINLRWGEKITEQVNYAYRIQDAAENIYVEGNWETNPAEPVDIGHPQRMWERPYWAVMQATGGEFWEQGLRYQRKIPLQVLDTPTSTAPYGSFSGRLVEALEYAAGRENDLFGQTAMLQLKQYQKLKPEVILQAIKSVQRGEHGKEILLTGLLGIWHRYRNEPEFPGTLKQPLEDCLRNSLLPLPAGEDRIEGLDLLALTCRLLVAQMEPDREFGEGKGAAIQAETEKILLEWTLERGRTGFREWDSCLSQDLITAGLTHLVSLAADTMVQESAAILLDKLFFGMAVTSFKGSNGSPQARASADAMKSAQMQATSGIQRILWGTGVFNPHIAGMVSLACSDYEFPLLIANIATNLPEEMWGRETSLIDPVKNLAADVATYRTPDAMLSSVQDYKPGEPGACEHIWQATLGADAIMFVNHPASLGESEALKPGFWRGNAVLPRVAQWKDVLISIHRLPEEDWLGFTHAFTPVHCFDECLIEKNWIFAHQGDGYLALTAQNGIEIMKQAPDAYRELRSPGRENTWIAMLGRKALDGSFEDFRKKVIELEVQQTGTKVRLDTLRGDRLEFDWTGPFLVNGQGQPLHGHKHYNNPYCQAELPANQMEITDGENIMRLDFSDQ